MNINDRIKQVRNELNQTQIEFGSKIGISQGHLTSIESGKRTVTEKTLKVICATFNISEEWLRTGKGSMFVENENVLLSQLAKQCNLDAFSRRFIEAFISLPQSHRDVIRSYALSLVEQTSDPLVPEVVINGSRIDDVDAAAQIASIANEMMQEKRARGKLSGLHSVKNA